MNPSILLAAVSLTVDVLTTQSAAGLDRTMLPIQLPKPSAPRRSPASPAASQE